MTKLRVITSPSGARFTVADEHADRFGGLVKDLEDAGIRINPNASGGYNPRNIRGSNKPSNHAFGRAIDINWDENPMGQQGKINPEVARSLAAKHGMTWGGDWKNRPDPMHFEVAGVPNVPLSQRAFTRVAGVQQTEPSTTGVPTPMPTYKNVGGQTYMGPEAAQQSRRLAEMLINQGTNQEPMTHWTQALGKVLMTGSGALRNDMAMKDMREGQQSGNQALAQLLMGGDGKDAMSNPYSADKAMSYQVSQSNASRRSAEAERLLKLKMDAERADPMYQAKLQRLQAETAALQNKGNVDQSRTTQLEQLGVDPASPEGMMYLANGKLPAEAFKLAKAKEMRQQSAAKIAAGLQNLNKLTDKYDDPSFNNAVGPFQGSTPDGGMLTAPFANIARGFGELSNSVEGGKSSPTEVRSEIASNTEAIAGAIKPLIRGPGEGPWTDADQARLVAIVGDLATSRDKPEFRRRLVNVKDALKSNFDLDIPFGQLEGAALMGRGAKPLISTDGWTDVGGVKIREKR
jgi:hypothetical protein